MIEGTNTKYGRGTPEKSREEYKFTKFSNRFPFYFECAVYKLVEMNETV
jgi:hypothetical protein